MSEIEETREYCFIDTNVWLYAFIETDDEGKRLAAKSAIQKPDIIVSTQVINEVCVTLNAECGVLYSEDMQDDLHVEGRLRIVNPLKLR